MKVQVWRPRVSDLVFQLFARPLHPELFDILATRRVQKDDHRVALWITRSGHVVTWEHRGICLAEVTAATEEPLPAQRRLLGYRVRGEHYGSLTCAPGVHYQMSFQVETLPPDIFLHVHDEILADGAKRGFLYNFQPHHRLAIAPLGFVTLEYRARSLVIQTFHTFPEEHTVVKSQSLIELTR